MSTKFRRRPHFSFTPIPHDFIENWINELKPNETKTYLAIMRMTWGYSKPNDTIAYSQLAEITHLSNSTVKRSIKTLKAKGLITVRGDPGMPRRIEPTLAKHPLGTRVTLVTPPQLSIVTRG